MSQTKSLLAAAHSTLPSLEMQAMVITENAYFNFPDYLLFLLATGLKQTIVRQTIVHLQDVSNCTKLYHSAL